MFLEIRTFQYRFRFLYEQVSDQTADEVVFDVFKVKESSFSESDLTDPPQILDGVFLYKDHVLSQMVYSLFERMRLKREKRSLFTLKIITSLLITSFRIKSNYFLTSRIAEFGMVGN